MCLQIIIEEITIDSSLHQTSNPHNPIRISRLSQQAVNPVEEIESAIATESEHVVRVERVDETSSLLRGAVNDDQLWQDRYSFEINGEGPQDLGDREELVDEAGETQTRDDQEEDIEVIVKRLIGAAIGFLILHNVNDGERERDEEDLEDVVVEGGEVPCQVEVASDENDGVENLSLQRDTTTRFCAVNLQ